MFNAQCCISQMTGACIAQYGSHAVLTHVQRGDFLLWSKREDSAISGIWNIVHSRSRGRSQPQGTDSRREH